VCFLLGRNLVVNTLLVTRNCCVAGSKVSAVVNCSLCVRMRKLLSVKNKRKAVYVERNIKVRSRNHFVFEKQ
jgi:hypothetical protein